MIDRIALDIKKALAEDDFMLSKTNPFFDWIRGENTILCRPEDLGLSFYITNPPVPPISHFDFHTALISFEPPPSDSIFFQLTFYFQTALEPCVEADEIHAVYDKHDAIWFPKLSEYFTGVENSFNLSWDTEYDESIEDNLSVRIPLDKAENILSLIKALKLQYEMAMGKIK